MTPLFETVFDSDTAKSYRKGLEQSDFFDNRRAIIPNRAKASILHELSVLGIDYGTIYKDIERKMKSIVEEEKWKSNNFKKYYHEKKNYFNAFIHSSI